MPSQHDLTLATRLVQTWAESCLPALVGIDAPLRGPSWKARVQVSVGSPDMILSCGEHTLHVQAVLPEDWWQTVEKEGLSIIHRFWQSAQGRFSASTAQHPAPAIRTRRSTTRRAGDGAGDETPTSKVVRYSCVLANVKARGCNSLQTNAGYSLLVGIVRTS